MALAAGSAWARVRLEAEDELFIAQSDIKDYFYSLALPDNIRSMLCLPPIPSDLIRSWKVPQSLGGQASCDGWVWPRLRVVPMGWSWAMWFSQRVHTHICLQSTGLGFDRLLVDGSACPDLSGGEVALLPYADNLNVLGTDQARVQDIKDCIVKGLRDLGFVVHEEQDASNLTQSLGFVIDGKAGVVCPVPERLDRLIKVFRWLSRRPRVSGKALERVLGHATHLCMLRRELLSMFRSCYDFIQGSYNSRTRLWSSAAKEARWASHLMKLCTANLRRKWSQDVTASDASLSGVSVSRRSLTVEQQIPLGSQSELWRYKANTEVKPRQSALGEIQKAPDPFSDPDTVKPMSVKRRDPFMLNAEFPEVEAEVMNKDMWHEVFSTRMTLPEHITLLEGRGIVAAVRHKLRSSEEFGKNHLHFNDNLGMVLACCKGRSSSFGMLRVSRRLCALILAADLSWVVRWIPSEIHVADFGSRRWEHLRVSENAPGRSQSQRKKEIDSFCYPSAGVARRWKIAFDGLDPGTQEGEESDSSAASEGQGREGGLSDQQSEVEDRRASLCRPDAFGETVSLRTSCPGLSEANGRSSEVCKRLRVESEEQEEVRRNLLQICEQHVRSRLRHPRCHQDHGRGHRQPPRLWPQGPPPKNSQSFAGLEQGGAATDQALGVGGFDGGDNGQEQTVPCSHSSASDVHRLPAARGGIGFADARPCPSYAK